VWHDNLPQVALRKKTTPPLSAKTLAMHRSVARYHGLPMAASQTCALLLLAPIKAAVLVPAAMEAAVVTLLAEVQVATAKATVVMLVAKMVSGATVGRVTALTDFARDGLR
jgi:hypothetical protein